MSENNVEEICAPTATRTEDNIENVTEEEQPHPTSSNEEENNGTNEQEAANAHKKSKKKKQTDGEQNDVDKSKRSAIILLIIVNVGALLCALTLFVMGVVMTANHARVHTEWHAGYGFWNASVICIVISVVLAGIASIGKLILIFHM